MGGFFSVPAGDVVDIRRLRPRGFKILLEILARHDLVVHEVPFTFGERFAGKSKATGASERSFLYQMAALRMGRMSRFAAVGILGTARSTWRSCGRCIHLAGVHYVPAAVIATEVAIVHNFLMQERFVFRDLRNGRHRAPVRFVQSPALQQPRHGGPASRVLILLVEQFWRCPRRWRRPPRCCSRSSPASASSRWWSTDRRTPWGRATRAVVSRRPSRPPVPSSDSPRDPDRAPTP